MVDHIPFITLEEYELILDVFIDPLPCQHLKQDIASTEHITFIIVLSFQGFIVNINECFRSRVLESPLLEGYELFFDISCYSEICDLELIFICYK